jgi:hypothetical protein
MDARLTAWVNSWAWLNTGFDYVQTELTALNRSLPRTPPMRGRVGMDFRKGN